MASRFAKLSVSTMRQIRTKAGQVDMGQTDGERNFHQYLQLKKVQVQVDELTNKAKTIHKVNPKGKSWAKMTLTDYGSFVRDNYFFFSLGVGMLFMDYKKLLEEKEDQKNDAGTKKNDAGTKKNDAGTA